MRSRSLSLPASAAGSITMKAWPMRGVREALAAAGLESVVVLFSLVAHRQHDDF